MISLPLPAEQLPPAFASGAQTLLLMRQVIVQLLAVIQQQTARIAAMEMLGISDEVRYNDLHHLSTMRT